MISPQHPFLRGLYCRYDLFDLNDPGDIVLALRAQAATDSPSGQRILSKHGGYPDSSTLREAVRFEWRVRGYPTPGDPLPGSLLALPERELRREMESEDELRAHDASWALLRHEETERLLPTLSAFPYADRPWARFLRDYAQWCWLEVDREVTIERLRSNDHFDACRLLLRILSSADDPRMESEFRRAMDIHPHCAGLLGYRNAKRPKWKAIPGLFSNLPSAMRDIVRLSRAGSRYGKIERSLISPSWDRTENRPEEG